MKFYVLSYNTFSCDDYFNLLVGIFSSKERLYKVIDDYDRKNLFDKEDAIFEEYHIGIPSSCKGLYIVSFKPMKETMIKVIGLFDNEKSAQEKIEFLKNDISMQSVGAEYFFGYYDIDIPYWREGFQLVEVE